MTPLTWHIVASHLPSNPLSASPLTISAKQFVRLVWQKKSVWVPLCLSFLLLQIAFCQQPPQSDQRAVVLAQQSLAALTSGASIADVTLNANVTWIAGSDTETGYASFQAKGTGGESYHFNLSGGTLTEIRYDVASTFPQAAQCKMVAPKPERRSCLC